MKPILFSTDMVQAILEGRKTMTRRVIPAKTVHWCECNVGQSDALAGRAFHTGV